MALPRMPPRPSIDPAFTAITARKTEDRNSDILLSMMELAVEKYR
jgi:hypothetical protein